jgi:hypothetical protein
MKGLVYEPTQGITIRNNSLVKAQEVLRPLENAEPLSYQWSRLFANYSGSIGINFEELGLTADQRASLVMYHYDDQWIPNRQYIISNNSTTIYGSYLDVSFKEHGLSITEDPDFDGYSSQDELTCGSDPYDTLSVPKDTDRDGIPDCIDPDDDNDGVLDAEDICPNTTFGAMVDVTGCEVFTLPKNNFNVRATAAICSGSNNGAIEVSAQNSDYTYTATITKSGTQVSQQTLSQSAGMTKSISTLGTGSYQVCFTVEEQTGYRRCFSVKIAEPKPLSTSASLDRSARLVTLNLSGSDKYFITHNGTTTTTDKQQITIALRSGNNTLEVNTDLGCQGTFFEEVFVSEEVILFPNPTEGIIQVYVAGIDQSINTKLWDLSGNIRIQQEVKVPQNRVIELDLTQLPSGVYVLTISGETVRTTEKIIKE